MLNFSNQEAKIHACHWVGEYYKKSSFFFHLNLRRQFHGSDLATNILDDYIVRFTNNLDPNNYTNTSSVVWPEYTSEQPQLYTFPRKDVPPNVTTDDYRLEPMRFLMNLSLAYPL